MYLFLTRRHAFGRGITGKFWLDDVKCTGEENSIDECRHRPWGQNNCLSHNQAGTVCKKHLNDMIIEPVPSKASGEVNHFVSIAIIFNLYIKSEC